MKISTIPLSTLLVLMIPYAFCEYSNEKKYNSYNSHVTSYDSDRHYEHYHKHEPNYEFNYGVKDPHTGDFKKQWEIRKGDDVKGEYSLLDADGTIRTVKYSVDGHNGFHATVTRKGTAKHPSSGHYHYHHSTSHHSGADSYATGPNLVHHKHKKQYKESGQPQSHPHPVSDTTLYLSDEYEIPIKFNGYDTLYSKPGGKYNRFDARYANQEVKPVHPDPTPDFPQPDSRYPNVLYPTPSSSRKSGHFLPTVDPEAVPSNHNPVYTKVEPDSDLVKKYRPTALPVNKQFDYDINSYVPRNNIKKSLNRADGGVFNSSNSNNKNTNKRQRKNDLHSLKNSFYFGR